MNNSEHRILVIQGHPDPDTGRYCQALSRAYREGAGAAGHAVREVRLADLDFPLLRSKHDFDHGIPPEAIFAVQEDVRWASHLVIIFPLWLGDIPALLKGLLEQVFRPGFAMQPPAAGQGWKKLLKGRSARLVITMGMPAFVYRWYFGAHAEKLLRRNILGFVGIAPVRRSLIGMVEGSPRRRERWLARMRELGQRAR